MGILVFSVLCVTGSPLRKDDGHFQRVRRALSGWEREEAQAAVHAFRTHDDDRTDPGKAPGIPLRGIKIRTLLSTQVQPPRKIYELHGGGTVPVSWVIRHGYT